MSFPGGSVSKASSCNSGDPDSILESGRSLGKENSNPLQYSSLGIPMDRGVWWATMHEVTRVRHDLGTEPPPFLIWSNSGWSWAFSLSLSLFFCCIFLCYSWVLYSDLWVKFPTTHKICYKIFHVLQKIFPFFHLVYSWGLFLTHAFIHCNFLSPWDPNRQRPHLICSLFTLVVS